MHRNGSGMYKKNNERMGQKGAADSCLEEQEIRLNKYCVSRLLWALAAKLGIIPDLITSSTMKDLLGRNK